jgi:hypothetical protein
MFGRAAGLLVAGYGPRGSRQAAVRIRAVITPGVLRRGSHSLASPASAAHTAPARTLARLSALCAPVAA